MSREYLVLKAWCEEPRIGCICPPIDALTKVVNRLWEELHYHQAGELDTLLEGLEKREHISSTKEAALKRLRPWLEKIFGSEHKIVDPEFVVRGRQRAARKGQSSALQSDESMEEEIVMSSTETEATTKKKVSAPKKKEVTAKKEVVADTVGVADIAKKMKVNPGDLRKALRTSKIKKPAGNWSWPKGHADLKAVEKLASSLK